MQDAVANKDSVNMRGGSIFSIYPSKKSGNFSTLTRSLKGEWLPLGQSHTRNVFKDVNSGAVVEQEEDPQEARGGRGGQERPGRDRLEPVPQ